REPRHRAARARLDTCCAVHIAASSTLRTAAARRTSLRTLRRLAGQPAGCAVATYGRPDSARYSRACSTATARTARHTEDCCTRSKRVHAAPADELPSTAVCHAAFSRAGSPPIEPTRPHEHGRSHAPARPGTHLTLRHVGPST